MSETLKTIIVDAATGETIERDMSSEEIAEREQIFIEQAQAKADEQAKTAARESALAKLAALGLTQEEIEAL